MKKALAGLCPRQHLLFAAGQRSRRLPVPLLQPGEEAVDRDVSFEVPEGKIITLIGANGAGKSTTLRSIIGLVPAVGGALLHNRGGLPFSRGKRL